MNVVGRHAPDPRLLGQFVQRIVACRVEWIAVIPQFDQHTVLSEPLDQLVEFASRRLGLTAGQSCGHPTLTAAGEDPDVAAQHLGQIGKRELRCTLLAGQMTKA